MYHIDIHQRHGWVQVDQRETLTPDVVQAVTMLKEVVRVRYLTGRAGYVKARLILLVSHGRIYYDSRDEVLQ